MKIIKIESCNHCYYSLIDNKRKVFCDELQIGVCMYDTTGTFIHPDCPLEDYKTTWQPISELKEITRRVWFLDKNNLIAKGCLVGYESGKQVFSFNLSELPEKFGTPVMFSETKPI